MVILTCALLLSAAGPSLRSSTPQTAVSEIVLNVDPAHSSVHWTVDSTLHTVHGTFALKNGSLHFDPESGRAGGEFVVYATSGDSGNASRDSRMDKEILETAKYPEVSFRPTQLDGHVALSGTSDAILHGLLSIHGTDHEVTAPVHAELNADRWKGTTRFEVPYVMWGLKDPSTFLLKVKHVVNVELELSGSLQSPK
jgi:polyisoprenoid-binding protein YceI